ncbi:MAG: RNA polymerase sigma factor [Planctomycetota bacterium JB042]
MGERDADRAPEELADLVRRAQAGDDGAADELLRSHLPGLRAFVRLRAGEVVRLKESASDLVHSVCREVLEELPSIEYRGEKAFRNWLFRAAERKIVDRARFWRAEKRDLAREASPAPGTDRDELMRSYASIHTPSRDAIVREEVERIEEAFDRLPDHYREVITLARLVGLPHKEIAEEMGRSEGAVRILLFRALAELSDHLR